MKISCCINVDSRPGVDADSTRFTGHNEGCRNFDFLTHGIINKRQFLNGFDYELIIYLDETIPVPDDTIRRMRELCDCLVIRKHFTSYRGLDQCGYANDIRYLQCLSQATGNLIIHFDADTMAFARDKGTVERLLALAEDHRFVSYPSPWSPRAVDDSSFGRHTWASTRFFVCRREWLKFDALELALREPESAYREYGDPPRRCPWLEHFLALLNGESVLYPHRDDQNLLIWCWRSYRSGVLEKLNARSFDEVLAYVTSAGGIGYPNDLDCLNL